MDKLVPTEYAQQIIDGLALFWRKGRKEFVPLLPTEVPGINADLLKHHGMLSEVKTRGGFTEYRVSMAGQKFYHRMSKP